MSTPPDYTKPYINRAGRKLKPVADRFWEKVNKTDTCWLWLGSQNGNGYGILSIDYKNVYVHRFAYELLVGPIPEGLTIDHRCSIRHCCNPDHLEPVTQRENNLRGGSPNIKLHRSGHCKKGHPFNNKNTYVRPSGHRQCRVCQRDWMRKFRARRKERLAQGL